MKLKAGGSRLLKCELFQHQKHNPMFASLLYPWGPSRKWRCHEKWNWKDFNERTIYKGVGRCQGATRNSEAPRNSCPRRLHHPRPDEMSGFAASISGRGSSCGRGGRIWVLWPQWKKVHTIQLRLGEEGVGKIKVTNMFPTFDIFLWSLLLGRPNQCWKFKWYHLRHRARWRQVGCGFGGIPSTYTSHTRTKLMPKDCIFIWYVCDQLDPKLKIVPGFFCFLATTHKKAFFKVPFFLSFCDFSELFVLYL